MLEREVKRLGYEPKVLMSPEKLKEAGSKIRIDTDENLLATLGYGGVTLNTVMSKLVEIYKKEQKLETTKDLAQVLAELKPRKSKAKASHGILVKGEEGIMVKRAAATRFPATRLSAILHAAAVFPYIVRTALIS